MSTPNPTSRRTISAEAQHVLDALEAHLGQVVALVQTASPGATKVLVEFGDAVLAKLDEWGVEFRGEVAAVKGKLDAASQLNTQATAPAPSLS
jgi:hypothetical protein